MKRNGIATRSLALFMAASMVAMVAMVAMATPAAAGDRDRARNQRAKVPGTTGPPNIVDAGWIELSMGRKGQSRGPFEVSSSGPLALTFTDMACLGDRMQALDSHDVVGNGTPLVVAPTCSVVKRGWGAVWDRRFSSGSVLLRSGSHQLSFRTLSTFTGGFAAAFRVDTCTVTRPTTLGVLQGGPERDVICGSPRRDTILGGGGDDLLLGGAGPDVVVAGEGRAVLVGGTSADFLAGGVGNNRLFGGAGADVLRAGPGKDGLSGQGAVDVLQGMKGTDALHGGAGRDVLLGGQNNDVCLAGPGAGVRQNCEAGHW